jgi:hypothetical protein
MIDDSDSTYLDAVGRNDNFSLASFSINTSPLSSKNRRCRVSSRNKRDRNFSMFQSGT